MLNMGCSLRKSLSFFSSWPYASSMPMPASLLSREPVELVEGADGTGGGDCVRSVVTRPALEGPAARRDDDAPPVGTAGGSAKVLAGANAGVSSAAPSTDGDSVGGGREARGPPGDVVALDARRRCGGPKPRPRPARPRPRGRRSSRRLGSGRLLVDESSSTDSSMRWPERSIEGEVGPDMIKQLLR